MRQLVPRFLQKKMVLGLHLSDAKFIKIYLLSFHVNTTVQRDANKYLSNVGRTCNPAA